MSQMAQTTRSISISLTDQQQRQSFNLDQPPEQPSTLNLPISIQTLYQTVARTSHNHHLGHALASLYTHNLAERMIITPERYLNYHYTNENLQNYIKTHIPSRPLFTLPVPPDHISPSNRIKPTQQSALLIDLSQMPISLDDIGLNTMLGFDPCREHVWRASLKEGMLVDCLDSTSAWYIAKIKYIFPGFVYVNYDGWSSKFDELIPITSSRLAPFLSHSSLSSRRKNDYALHVYEDCMIKLAEVEAVWEQLTTIENALLVESGLINHITEQNQGYSLLPIFSLKNTKPQGPSPIPPLSSYYRNNPIYPQSLSSTGQSLPQFELTHETLSQQPQYHNNTLHKSNSAYLNQVPTKPKSFTHHLLSSSSSSTSSSSTTTSVLSSKPHDHDDHQGSSGQLQTFFESSSSDDGLDSDHDIHEHHDSKIIIDPTDEVHNDSTLSSPGNNSTINDPFDEIFGGDLYNAQAIPIRKGIFENQPQNLNQSNTVPNLTTLSQFGSNADVIPPSNHGGFIKHLYSNYELPKKITSGLKRGKNGRFTQSFGQMDNMETSLKSNDYYAFKHIKANKDHSKQTKRVIQPSIQEQNDELIAFLLSDNNHNNHDIPINHHYSSILPISSHASTTLTRFLTTSYLDSILPLHYTTTLMDNTTPVVDISPFLSNLISSTHYSQQRMYNPITQSSLSTMLDSSLVSVAMYAQSDLNQHRSNINHKILSTFHTQLPKYHPNYTFTTIAHQRSLSDQSQDQGIINPPHILPMSGMNDNNNKGSIEQRISAHDIAKHLSKSNNDPTTILDPLNLTSEQVDEYLIDNNLKIPMVPFYSAGTAVNQRPHSHLDGVSKIASFPSYSLDSLPPTQQSISAQSDSMHSTVITDLGWMEKNHYFSALMNYGVVFESVIRPQWDIQLINSNYQREYDIDIKLLFGPTLLTSEGNTPQILNSPAISTNPSTSKLQVSKSNSCNEIKPQRLYSIHHNKRRIQPINNVSIPLLIHQSLLNTIRDQYLITMEEKETSKHRSKPSLSSRRTTSIRNSIHSSRGNHSNHGLIGISGESVIDSIPESKFFQHTPLSYCLLLKTIPLLPLFDINLHTKRLSSRKLYPSKHPADLNIMEYPQSILHYHSPSTSIDQADNAIIRVNSPDLTGKPVVSPATSTKRRNPPSNDDYDQADTDDQGETLSPPDPLFSLEYNNHKNPNSIKNLVFITPSTATTPLLTKITSVNSPISDMINNDSDHSDAFSTPLQAKPHLDIETTPNKRFRIINPNGADPTSPSQCDANIGDYEGKKIGITTKYGQITQSTTTHAGVNDHFDIVPLFSQNASRHRESFQHQHGAMNPEKYNYTSQMELPMCPKLINYSLPFTQQQQLTSINHHHLTPTLINLFTQNPNIPIGQQISHYLYHIYTTLHTMPITNTINTTSFITTMLSLLTQLALVMKAFPTATSKLLLTNAVLHYMVKTSSFQNDTINSTKEAKLNQCIVELATSHQKNKVSLMTTQSTHVDPLLWRLDIDYQHREINNHDNTTNKTNQSKHLELEKILQSHPNNINILHNNKHTATMIPASLNTDNPIYTLNNLAQLLSSSLESITLGPQDESKLNSLIAQLRRHFRLDEFPTNSQVEGNIPLDKPQFSRATSFTLEANPLMDNHSTDPSDLIMMLDDLSIVPPSVPSLDQGVSAPDIREMPNHPAFVRLVEMFMNILQTHGIDTKIMQSNHVIDHILNYIQQTNSTITNPLYNQIVEQTTIFPSLDDTTHNDASLSSSYPLILPDSKMVLIPNIITAQSRQSNPTPNSMDLTINPSGNGDLYSTTPHCLNANLSCDEVRQPTPCAMLPQLLPSGSLRLTLSPDLCRVYVVHPHLGLVAMNTGYHHSNSLFETQHTNQTTTTTTTTSPGQIIAFNQLEGLGDHLNSYIHPDNINSTSLSLLTQGDVVRLAVFNHTIDSKSALLFDLDSLLRVGSTSLQHSLHHTPTPDNSTFLPILSVKNKTVLILPSYHLNNTLTPTISFSPLFLPPSFNCNTEFVPHLFLPPLVIILAQLLVQFNNGYFHFNKTLFNNILHYLYTTHYHTTKMKSHVASASESLQIPGVESMPPMCTACGTNPLLFKRYYNEKTLKIIAQSSLSLTQPHPNLLQNDITFYAFIEDLHLLPKAASNHPCTPRSNGAGNSNSSTPISPTNSHHNHHKVPRILCSDCFVNENFGPQHTSFTYTLPSHHNTHHDSLSSSDEILSNLETPIEQLFVPISSNFLMQEVTSFLTTFTLHQDYISTQATTSIPHHRSQQPHQLTSPQSPNTTTTRPRAGARGSLQQPHQQHQQHQRSNPRANALVQKNLKPHQLQQAQDDIMYQPIQVIPSLQELMSRVMSLSRLSCLDGLYRFVLDLPTIDFHSSVTHHSDKPMVDPSPLPIITPHSLLITQSALSPVVSLSWSVDPNNLSTTHPQLIDFDTNLNPSNRIHVSNHTTSGHLDFPTPSSQIDTPISTCYHVALVDENKSSKSTVTEMKQYSIFKASISPLATSLDVSLSHPINLPVIAPKQNDIAENDNSILNSLSQLLTSLQQSIMIQSQINNIPLLISTLGLVYTLITKSYDICNISLTEPYGTITKGLCELFLLCLELITHNLLELSLESTRSLSTASISAPFTTYSTPTYTRYGQSTCNRSNQNISEQSHSGFYSLNSLFGPQPHGYDQMMNSDNYQPRGPILECSANSQYDSPLPRSKLGHNVSNDSPPDTLTPLSFSTTTSTTTTTITTTNDHKQSYSGTPSMGESPEESHQAPFILQPTQIQQSIILLRAMCESIIIAIHTPTDLNTPQQPLQQLIETLCTVTSTDQSISHHTDQSSQRLLTTISNLFTVGFDLFYPALSQKIDVFGCLDHLIQSATANNSTTTCPPHTIIHLIKSITHPLLKTHSFLASSNQLPHCGTLPYFITNPISFFYKTQPPLSIHLASKSNSISRSTISTTDLVAFLLTSTAQQRQAQGSFSTMNQLRTKKHSHVNNLTCSQIYTPTTSAIPFSLTELLLSCDKVHSTDYLTSSSREIALPSTLLAIHTSYPFLLSFLIPLQQLPSLFCNQAINPISHRFKPYIERCLAWSLSTMTADNPLSHSPSQSNQAQNTSLLSILFYQQVSTTILHAFFLQLIALNIPIPFMTNLRTTFQSPPRLPNLQQASNQASLYLNPDTNQVEPLVNLYTEGDDDPSQFTTYYPQGAEVHARWENTNFYPGLSRGITLKNNKTGWGWGEEHNIRNFLSSNSHPSNFLLPTAPQFAHSSLNNIGYTISFFDGDIDQAVAPLSVMSLRSRVPMNDDTTPEQRQQYDNLTSRAFSGVKIRDVVGPNPSLYSTINTSTVGNSTNNANEKQKNVAFTAVASGTHIDMVPNRSFINSTSQPSRIPILQPNAELYFYNGLYKPLSMKGCEFIRFDAVSKLFEMRFRTKFQQPKENSMSPRSDLVQSPIPIRLQEHDLNREIQLRTRDVVYYQYLPVLSMLNNQTTESIRASLVSQQIEPFSLFDTVPSLDSPLVSNRGHKQIYNPITPWLVSSSPLSSFNSITNQPNPASALLEDQSMKAYRNGSGLVAQQYLKVIPEMLIEYSSLLLQHQHQTYSSHIEPVNQLISTTLLSDTNALINDKIQRLTPPLSELFQSTSLIQSNHTVESRQSFGATTSSIFDFCLTPALKEINHSYVGHLPYQARSVFLQHLMLSLLNTSKLLSALIDLFPLLYQNLQQQTIQSFGFTTTNEKNRFYTLASRSKIGKMLGLQFSPSHQSNHESRFNSPEIDPFHDYNDVMLDVFDDDDPEIQIPMSTSGHSISKSPTNTSHTTTLSPTSSIRKNRSTQSNHGSFDIDIYNNSATNDKQREHLTILTKSRQFTPFDNISEASLYLESLLGDLGSFIQAKLNHITHHDHIPSLSQLKQIQLAITPALTSFSNKIKEQVSHHTTAMPALITPQLSSSSQTSIGHDIHKINQTQTDLKLDLQTTIALTLYSSLCNNYCDQPVSFSTTISPHINTITSRINLSGLTLMVSETISRLKSTLRLSEQLFSLMVEEITIESIPLSSLLTTTPELPLYYQALRRHYNLFQQQQLQYTQPQRQAQYIQFDTTNSSILPHHSQGKQFSTPQFGNSTSTPIMSHHGHNNVNIPSIHQNQSATAHVTPTHATPTHHHPSQRQLQSRQEPQPPHRSSRNPLTFNATTLLTPIQSSNISMFGESVPPRQISPSSSQYGNDSDHDLAELERDFDLFNLNSETALTEISSRADDTLSQHSGSHRTPQQHQQPLTKIGHFTLYQILPPSLQHPDISSTTNKQHREAMTLFSSTNQLKAFTATSGRVKTRNHTISSTSQHDQAVELAVIQHLLSTLSTGIDNNSDTYSLNSQSSQQHQQQQQQQQLKPTKNQNQFLSDFVKAPLSHSTSPLDLKNIQQYLSNNFGITMTPSHLVPKELPQTASIQINSIFTGLKYIPSELPPAAMLSLIFEQYLHEKTIQQDHINNNPATMDNSTTQSHRTEKETIMHNGNYQLESLFTFEKVFLLSFIRQHRLFMNNDNTPAQATTAVPLSTSTNNNPQGHTLSTLFCSYPYSFDLHALLTTHHNTITTPPNITPINPNPINTLPQTDIGDNITTISSSLPPFLQQIFEYIYQNCHIPLLMILKRDHKRFQTLQSLISMLNTRQQNQQQQQQHSQQQAKFHHTPLIGIQDDLKQDQPQHSPLHQPRLAFFAPPPPSPQQQPLHSQNVPRNSTINNHHHNLSSPPLSHTSSVGGMSNSSAVQRRQSRQNNKRQAEVDGMVNKVVGNIDPETPHQDGYMVGNRYHPSYQFNYLMFQLISRLYLFSVDFQDNHHL